MELLPPLNSKPMLNNSRGVGWEVFFLCSMFTPKWRHNSLCSFQHSYWSSIRSCHKGQCAPRAETPCSLNIASFLANLLTLPLVDTLTSVTSGDSCPLDMCAELYLLTAPISGATEATQGRCSNLLSLYVPNNILGNFLFLFPVWENFKKVILAC